MRRQELHPRTAVLNKSQKNQSKKSRNEALNWLAANFPLVFDTSLYIRPLKIKIMDDILAQAEGAQESGISKSKLRQAVVLFTRRIDYLACLKAREMRVDLQGNPVAPVTDEEAERASVKIKKRIEKSARNARKNIASKIPSHFTSTKTPSPQPPQDFVPRYPERPPAFSAAQSTPVRTAAVVVKRKPSRQYDPDTVARLKEKLGLSRKAEISKEIIE